MQSFNLKPQTVGFIVGTRAALALGLGLLVASRIPEERRKRIGLALLGLGAATTIPALHLLRRSRTQQPERRLNGAYTEFNFARQM